MSRILDRLQEAEEQRQRLIAERRRLETEADAALAAHDREAQLKLQAESPRPGLSSPAPLRRSPHVPWTWATVALAFFAVAVFVLPESKQAPAGPVAEETRPVSVFKLDRDLDAFAARVRAMEKP